jgi:hypothetical protein
VTPGTAIGRGGAWPPSRSDGQCNVWRATARIASRRAWRDRAGAALFVCAPMLLGRRSRPEACVEYHAIAMTVCRTFGFNGVLSSRRGNGSHRVSPHRYVIASSIPSPAAAAFS